MPLTYYWYEPQTELAQDNRNLGYGEPIKPAAGTRMRMCSVNHDCHLCSHPEAPEQPVHLKDLDHYFCDYNNGPGP